MRTLQDFRPRLAAPVLPRQFVIIGRGSFSDTSTRQIDRRDAVRASLAYIWFAIVSRKAGSENRPDHAQPGQTASAHGVFTTTGTFGSSLRISCHSAEGKPAGLATSMVFTHAWRSTILNPTALPWINT